MTILTLEEQSPLTGQTSRQMLTAQAAKARALGGRALTTARVMITLMSAEECPKIQPGEDERKDG